MLNCPKCGSPRIHRSRTRTFWERVHKRFTRDRLHRCHGCGWRGWGPVTYASIETPERMQPAPTPPPADVAVPQPKPEEKKPGSPPSANLG